MIGPRAQVLRRCQTAELLEIMNEVRLIIITERNGKIGPIDCVPVINLADYLLKPLDSTEKFWRQPDLISKNFNESSLAETGSFRQFDASEQSRISPKLSDCV